TSPYYWTSYGAERNGLGRRWQETAGAESVPHLSSQRARWLDGDILPHLHRKIAPPGRGRLYSMLYRRPRPRGAPLSHHSRTTLAPLSHHSHVLLRSQDHTAWCGIGTRAGATGTHRCCRQMDWRRCRLRRPWGSVLRAVQRLSERLMAARTRKWRIVCD